MTSDMESGRRPMTATNAPTSGISLAPLVSASAVPPRPGTASGTTTNPSTTPFTASGANAGALSPTNGDGSELGDVLHDLNGLFAGAAGGGHRGDKSPDKDDPAMCTI